MSEGAAVQRIWDELLFMRPVRVLDTTIKLDTDEVMRLIETRNEFGDVGRDTKCFPRLRRRSA